MYHDHTVVIMATLRYDYQTFFEGRVVDARDRDVRTDWVISGQYKDGIYPKHLKGYTQSMIAEMREVFYSVDRLPLDHYNTGRPEMTYGW